MNKISVGRESRFTSWKVLTYLVGQYPIAFLSLLFVTAIQSAVNVLSVLVVAPIVDLLFQPEESAASGLTNWLVEIGEGVGVELDIRTLFFVFGLVLLLGGLLGVLTKLVVLKIKYLVLEDLLGSTFGRFFRAGYQFFSNGEIGKLLNSFQKEVEKLGDTLGLSVTGVVAFFQGFVYISIPFVLSPEVSLRFLAIGIALTFPLLMLRRLSTKFGAQSTQTGNFVMKVIHEALTGAKVIIAFGRANEVEAQYRTEFSAHAKAAISFSTLVSGVSLLFVPMGSIAALLAIYHAYETGYAITDLAVVLFGFFRGLPHLATALQSKTSIEGFLPAFKQVDDLINQADELVVISGVKKFESIDKGITFRNISFSYMSSSENVVLRDVSFEIDKNNLVVMTGQSGSGKTTAMDLMLGLYAPTSGEILVDGVPIQEFSRASFLEKVGYVPQDPYLFDGSIKENLLWANPRATEKMVKKALERAHLEEVIERLENGINTRLGDRGGKLSGGQRQRVALARAIVVQPEILFLDEFTSALDEALEGHIIETIQHLRDSTTIVVVTHRRELMRIADSVIVFNQGSIVNEGPYQSISASLDSFLTTS